LEEQKKLNTIQRIIKNTLSLLIGNVISNFLGFVAIVYLARVLGPGFFGKINFAIAIVAYFIFIANMGLPLVGTRGIARDKEKTNDYLSAILTLRLCLAALSFGLLLLITFFLIKPLETKYLIIIYGLELIPSALFLGWAFQGIERMEYIGLGRILGGGVYLGLVLWLIKSPEQLLLVPCFQVADRLIVAGMLIFIFSRLFSKPRFGLSSVSLKSIFRQALPIGLTGFLSVIIYYLDTVMLGFMKSNEEVGYYNAAYKIILLLVMIITTYHDSVFPVISNYYKNSLDSFKKLQSYTTKLMVTFALPLGVGGTILARKLINVIYGVEYGRATIALQILIWACALIFINTAYSRGLFATNREKECLKIVTMQAVIAIILNFILIPPLGLVGASVATVLGETCGLLMYYRALGKIINLSIHNYIFKPLFASVIMGLFLWISFDWNLFLLVIGGVSIFLAILYLTKGINIEEIRLLKKAISRV